MDFLERLRENKRYVDELIERFFPREVDDSYLEWLLGRPAYGYDAATIQRTVFEPMWDLLDRGGKRWRLWLYLTMARCLGVELDGYSRLCVVIELIHNGSLIADDVEDSALVRRGGPAIHVKYGEDVAVNLSSAMYFMPVRLLLEMGLDDRTFRRLVTAYFEDMIRIHFGQATDIGWHRGLRDPGEVTVEEYLQMCANKTGVLPRMAAKFAAILAGLPDGDVERLGRFAETVGVAFQIRDDVLNLTGGEKLGKERGEDITEGKVSLPVIYAMRRAPPEGRERLRQILRMHTRDRRLIEEAISIIEESGAIEEAQETAKRMVREAWSEAEGVLPDNEHKEMLRQLVVFLVEREM